MLGLKGRFLPPPIVIYDPKGKVKEPAVGRGTVEFDRHRVHHPESSPSTLGGY